METGWIFLFFGGGGGGGSGLKMKGDLAVTKLVLTCHGFRCSNVDWSSVCPHTHTHTHTHMLILSLSHTHKHTQTLWHTRPPAAPPPPPPPHTHNAWRPGLQWWPADSLPRCVLKPVSRPRNKERQKGRQLTLLNAYFRGWGETNDLSSMTFNHVQNRG